LTYRKYLDFKREFMPAQKQGSNHFVFMRQYFHKISAGTGIRVANTFCGQLCEQAQSGEYKSLKTKHFQTAHHF